MEFIDNMCSTFWGVGWNVTRIQLRAVRFSSPRILSPLSELCLSFAIFFREIGVCAPAPQYFTSQQKRKRCILSGESRLWVTYLSSLAC